ncbi:MAG: 30S ribosomal protein S7 [Candidatus Latescibacterota bacterium]|nr:MAG: 30S ribosomal protein S7 [Candidatus Latescibacterota bacterium]RKY71849.1 MAG: 30S ribosomal protein S7 [Candidatus Latescibacterota bacterium]
MPRRRRPEKRQLLPDPKFGSVLVTKFVNNLMRQGKKSVAESIFYRAIDLIEEKTGQSGLEVFEKAVENVKPVVEVKPRRVGGATYQVPVEVRPERRLSLSIKWLVSFARSRPEKTMAERLAAELLAASKGEGSAIKKRDDTHRMAEANKAFAHYRW